MAIARRAPDPLQNLIEMAGPLIGGPQNKMALGQLLQDPQVQQLIEQALTGMMSGQGGGSKGMQMAGGMPDGRGGMVDRQGNPMPPGFGQGGDSSYYVNGQYYDRNRDVPGMGPDAALGGKMMMQDRAMRGSQEMPSNSGDPATMAQIWQMMSRAPQGGPNPASAAGGMPDEALLEAIQNMMGRGDREGSSEDANPNDERE